MPYSTKKDITPRTQHLHSNPQPTISVNAVTGPVPTINVTSSPNSPGRMQKITAEAPEINTASASVSAERKVSRKFTSAFFSLNQQARKDECEQKSTNEKPPTSGSSLLSSSLSPRKTPIFGRQFSTDIDDSPRTRSDTPNPKRECVREFTFDEHSSLIKNYQALATEHSYLTESHDGFIWFSKPCPEGSPTTPTLKQKKGIKFHVSINHLPQHFSSGTTAIVQLLMQQDCKHFKIVEPQMLSSPQYGEVGREITIYTYMCSERAINEAGINPFWSNLIRMINQELNSLNIWPYIYSNGRQIPPRADTIIPGNSFTTWRDDSRSIPGVMSKECHPDREPVIQLSALSYFKSNNSQKSDKADDNDSQASLERYQLSGK